LFLLIIAFILSQSEELNIIENKNIDFVDALICTKNKLQGFGKLSFDADVEK